MRKSLTVIVLLAALVACAYGIINISLHYTPILYYYLTLLKNYN